MIQDVKTHNNYAINKCAFLLGFYLEMLQQSDPFLDQKVNYKRGVAYDDSYCNKLRASLGRNSYLRFWVKWPKMNPSKFGAVTIIAQYIDRPHQAPILTTPL